MWRGWPSWVGAGGGVIALSSLSPGGLCGEGFGTGGHMATQTHRSQHGGQVGWGRLGAILHFGSGARQGPPQMEPGEETGGHHIPSHPWRERLDPQSGAGEEDRAAMCPALGGAEGWFPAFSRNSGAEQMKKEAAWAVALVPAPAESITPHRLSCRPPLCPPWTWWAQGGPRHPRCQSCSR